MSERFPLGLLLIVAGGCLIFVGALVWSGALSWFGRLPGDIRIERPGVRVYFPLASMLLISAVLTLLLSLIRRYWS